MKDADRPQPQADATVVPRRFDRSIAFRGTTTWLTCTFRKPRSGTIKRAQERTLYGSLRAHARGELARLPTARLRRFQEYDLGRSRRRKNHLPRATAVAHRDPRCRLHSAYRAMAAARPCFWSACRWDHSSRRRSRSPARIWFELRSSWARARARPASSRNGGRGDRVPPRRGTLPREFAVAHYAILMYPAEVLGDDALWAKARPQSPATTAAATA